MNEPMHSKTPWHVELESGQYAIVGPKHPSVWGEIDDWIATANGASNAEHIVQCVNQHDMLVSALKQMYEMVNTCVYGGSNRGAEKRDTGMARDVLRAAGVKL